MGKMSVPVTPTLSDSLPKETTILGLEGARCSRRGVSEQSDTLPGCQWVPKEGDVSTPDPDRF